MTISKRLLKKWRKEALQEQEAWEKNQTITIAMPITWNERILRMTQELLDQHMLREEDK